MKDLDSGRRAIAEAARDATFTFLGRFEVCGVGMCHENGASRISFLLRRDSKAARAQLGAWAAAHRVAIEIAVAKDGIA